ncbi:MAG: hypothetical protein A2X25_08970 [Chloroflexi bacterium GWB2_49_20]|nr:MAG: hypothetical protein A2X25_08970 [Chloroflexi bacterium GWB2_49_20]OGN79436.1 MAG: hypothetical protein A2X26_05055 [Chloroflexi bacterium GWC2_49_37]OGN82795.1 MAG: hypothetical protein A2X27_07640 [Chloroflexi bacterium GWD2_49_16]
MKSLFADQLSSLKAFGEPLTVSLSNELVKLLSDQLYQSPLKAVEELVVNAYDADAKVCRVFVPAPSDTENDFIVIFDDGVGMDYEGLVNLWQIGRSNKRDENIQKMLKRKQIGKFGIGKLASRTIAYKLTHITKTGNRILSVTVDFRDFKDNPSATTQPVITSVREIVDKDFFNTNVRLSKMLDACGIKPEEIGGTKYKTWTLAILEDLTEKARKIRQETLHWILSTAMPLQSDFVLFLNGTKVLSSKEVYEKWVEFNISELPAERLKALQESTGEKWSNEGNYLKSASFPSGVSGSVFVTKPSLSGGKSEDLIRSYGFFVRVRGRLINDNDPLFGLKPLFFGLYYRFHADIYADDLDEDLKASRETIEDTTIKDNFRHLLREIFNHTNHLYVKAQAAEDEKRDKKEGERNQVSPRLVEYQVADVLVENTKSFIGSEADESWFYLSLSSNDKLDDLIKTLYTPKREKYTYQYINNGPTARIVKFDPASSTFWINKDHEFAAEFINEGVSRLLQEVVTAEALLEVYLRENQVSISAIGKILEQRDELLRSLIRDHSYSFETIARRLRDAATDKYELEISLVVAARSLGFTATHIAGAGNPDGLALFTEYPGGEKKITLEAKSSIDTPSLVAIDFASLQEHVINEKADGCLLVAPNYPGDSQEHYAAQRRANNLKISCWTVEQLALFVESAEKRQFNANNILDIALTAFTPDEVTAQIKSLFEQPIWDKRSLYRAILNALRHLGGRLMDSPRTIDLVAGEVSRDKEFLGINKESIKEAASELAGASQGGMTFRDPNIIMHVSVDELERRLINLTKGTSEPRRLSSFSKHE